MQDKTDVSRKNSAVFGYQSDIHWYCNTKKAPKTSLLCFLQKRAGTGRYWGICSTPNPNDGAGQVASSSCSSHQMKISYKSTEAGKEKNLLKWPQTKPSLATKPGTWIEIKVCLSP